jgi:hypothetical protein
MVIRASLTQAERAYTRKLPLPLGPHSSDILHNLITPEPSKKSVLREAGEAESENYEQQHCRRFVAHSPSDSNNVFSRVTGQACLWSPSL